MRVLFLNYEYPPLGGGAGNATFYILREFSKMPDLEVDLVTSSIDKDYHLETIGDNIKIHRLPIGKNQNNLHFQSQVDLIKYTWKAYFFSRELIKNNKYDLNHSFFTVPCGFLSLLLKWQYKIPYMVSLRGSDVPGYSERFPIIYKILKPLIKKIWSKADFVVANSQGLKELALCSKSNQPIEVIPNGIDIEKFKPAASQREFTFQILCVSRLTKRKGIGYLINAFSILAKKHPQLRLKIVGEGDEKEALINKVKELFLENKIEFTGLVEHDKLPQIYQLANIFVLPSLNEGMSNTVLEAIASGLSVITTLTGGTNELVKNGINGFIVKMKDSDDLAQKIGKIISDNGLRSKMALESRNIAVNFSWKNVADKYLELYEKINR